MSRWTLSINERQFWLFNVLSKKLIVYFNILDFGYRQKRVLFCSLNERYLLWDRLVWYVQQKIWVWFVLERIICWIFTCHRTGKLLNVQQSIFLLRRILAFLRITDTLGKTVAWLIWITSISYCLQTLKLNQILWWSFFDIRLRNEKLQFECGQIFVLKKSLLNGIVKKFINFKTLFTTFKCNFHL